MTMRIATALIALGILVIPVAQAGESPQVKQAGLTKEGLRTLDGATLYKELCAGCHGLSGRGDAKAMDVLTPPPADLTRLAADNGGRYPASRVRQAIAGDTGVAESAMPCWEKALESKLGKAQARLRVHSLTQYVKSLQKTEMGEG